MNKVILIVLLLGMITGIAWAGCKLDWSCYYSCSFDGDWSPGKDRWCKQTCMVCE